MDYDFIPMHPPRVQVKALSKSIFERRNQLQGFYDYFLKHHTSMWFFIEKKKTLETIPIKLRKLNGNQQGLVELCHRLYYIRINLSRHRIFKFNYQ